LRRTPLQHFSISTIQSSVSWNGSRQLTKRNDTEDLLQLVKRVRSISKKKSEFTIFFPKASVRSRHERAIVEFAREGHAGRMTLFFVMLSRKSGLSLLRR
jgi:hypothetical protein